MPDAGPDAAPDAAVVADAGPDPIECPDLDVATAAAETSTVPQEVIITRVVFDGANVDVTFRAIVNFTFAGVQLCTGSALAGDCDDGVQNEDPLLAGEEVTVTTALGDIVTAASGELALVNGLPAVDNDPIIRAYINWGDYESLPAVVGPNTGESLEEAAVEEGGGGVWVTNDSVAVNGQTIIYATGDVTGADGFEVCTTLP